MMRNVSPPKTHRERCELACRFLRNHGFKVVLSTCFYAQVSFGKLPDALGFRNGASCLIEVICSRSDFLADRKKVFRAEPEKGMGDWRFYLCEPGVITVDDLPAGWGGCMWLTGGSGKCMAGPGTTSGRSRKSNPSGQTNRLNAIICSVRCVARISGTRRGMIH